MGTTVNRSLACLYEHLGFIGAERFIEYAGGVDAAVENDRSVGDNITDTDQR